MGCSHVDKTDEEDLGPSVICVGLVLLTAPIRKKYSMYL